MALFLSLLAASAVSCAAPVSEEAAPSSPAPEVSPDAGAVEGTAPSPAPTYEQITQSEAKALMDSETGAIILDVRTEEEFALGHIAGAILIPDTEIGQRAEQILTDKDALILVYCRSGRRSKNPASELAALGYTNVKEFGGIIDWEYGTVTE